tara:strand:- start:502 stop:1860 length:1359 start_codon:yes stop_codon:yes gene_type:complete
MKKVKSFSEFTQLLEQFTPGATGVMGEPKLEKAADVIGQYVNKKTGGKYKKFPFIMYHNGVPGVMFYSSKNESAFRVGGNPNKKVPGLIGSLDYLEKFYNDKSTFTLTSDEFPLIKLVGEFVNLIKDPKYALEVMNESMVVEAKRWPKLTPEQKKYAQLELSKGRPVSSIAKEMNAGYYMVAKVKRDLPLNEEPIYAEEQNTMTLNDKVQWLEETMQDVYDISRSVAAGAFNSLFISGRAGTGKTYNVERAMHDEGLREGEDWIKISGALSTIIMYKQLFEYRDKVLVFDDCDAVFSNEDGRNILKAALDTKKIRNISYMKKMKMLFDPKDFENDPEGELNALESGQIPNRFGFAGRVIFISNLDKNKADPDGAIRSRSILVDINPEDATLMERMRVLLPHLEPRDMPMSQKEEIYEFMKDAKSVSMRTFVKAAGFKMADLPNWKRMAQRYV